MSIIDKLSESEKTLKVYSVDNNGKQFIVYEVRFSNNKGIAKSSLEFIKKDFVKYKNVVIIFNAKYIDSSTTFAKSLYTDLKEYRNVFFDKRVYKFAVIVKGFVKHRMVIGAFDLLFQDSKESIKKFNYFSNQKKDDILKWLLT